MVIKTENELLAAFNTAYNTRIADLHASLGIAPGYAQRSGLPLQFEPDELVDAGKDMFDRDQKLTAPALAAWLAMQRSAAQQGVTLLLVSAFRSVDYQTRLIRKKLDSGRTLEDVMQFNAAPGFSEHHTGRAIDIACPDAEPLQQAFENTNAFKWLSANAGGFGFVMTYPRDHRHAISYEPWHWCFNLDQ
jgi:D-alanyl-D-alanine carboxypeptidase